jgi:hypothetical protein
MGRAAGFLAGLVALARLVVDALLVFRDLRHGGAETEPVGAAELGGPPEAPAPDCAGGMGSGRKAEGPAEGQGPDTVGGLATGA